MWVFGFLAGRPDRLSRYDVNRELLPKGQHQENLLQLETTHAPATAQKLFLWMIRCMQSLHISLLKDLVAAQRFSAFRWSMIKHIS